MKKSFAFRNALGLLALAAAWPLSAVEVPVRNLSGPPSEFESHRLPDARKIGVPSNLLVVGGGGDPASAALPPSGGSTSFSASPGVGFSAVQATTVYPYFAPAVFTGPNGSRYAFDGWSVSCNWGACTEDQASVHIETLGTGGAVAVFSVSGGEVPSGGSWDLTVQPPVLPATLEGSPQIETVVSFDDNVVVVSPEPNPCQYASLLPPTNPEPEPPCPYLPFGSGYSLVDGAAPLFRIAFANNELKRRDSDSPIQLTGLRVSVIDTATRRPVHDEQLGLGRLAALPADSGGANLVPLPRLAAGNYTVRFDVRGIVAGVGPIERTAFYSLPILPRGYQLQGEATGSAIDAERLELLLGIDAPSPATPHVYAYAEVWSGDGRRPIAWVGGMTQPRTDGSGLLQLPLVLDGRWLALAGADERELRLKNVRIQDADTFLPLSQLAEIPVVLAGLPRSAALSTREVEQDDSLFMGKGDRTISLAETASAARPEEPSLTWSTTGIFLVHGWCSGRTWPETHFGRPGRVGGTETFLDPSASRSHDAFAREIRDQGAANFGNSFTIVAHSQGGAAATHLRAFYPSLLDLSNAPRRIQTMGTPYQGSTLMDYYLATGPLGWIIASIFGQCTQSFDLGTFGSQLWLANLPSWVRGDVYYYRTGYRRARTFWEKLQFWRWRCNAASFLIPGWDDGVVADFQGFLPGGHNMGVSESECHTSGMNHADQTENWNRNDILDREGRPAAATTNRALTATASASSSYSPGCSPGLHCYFPQRVNDGNRSTALGGDTSWCNNGGAMPQWVQLAWTTPITFTRIDLYSTVGYEIANFRIEYRTSASGPWLTLATVSGNTSSYRGPFNFAATTAQAIRILATSGSAAQPGYARVNEIEVY